MVDVLEKVPIDSLIDSSRDPVRVDEQDGNPRLAPGLISTRKQ